ncbi:MAG: putative glycoside hydrolase [Endomicrobiales bacterium]|nr:putative glycoside hydrolase [Endomicrobiales bacterium]
MKEKNNIKFYIINIAAISLFLFLLNIQASKGADQPKESTKKLIKGPLSSIEKKYAKNNTGSANKPKYVRGIHVTPWTAGSHRARKRINKLLNHTELNTIVIAIKEVKGEVHIPGVKQAEEFSTYVYAIPNIEQYLKDLNDNNVYTIARIVVFKDDLAARIKPDWAVKDSSGTIWQDKAGMAWVDPFNREAWNYNLSIAKRAVELGFDEIQFDYIRFPSDGNISRCRYEQVYSSITGSAILVEFLKEASRQLEPLGVNISIDLFGLATTNKGDLGIGQRIVEMSECVDFVSPMVYPSHYREGTYNIPVPEKDPYSTIFISLSGAKKRMGSSYTKLRPYLQDFSLKHEYRAKEVKEQIQACYDNDIGEWLLWDPTCRYTKEALREKEFADVYEKSGRPNPRIIFSSSTIKK